MNTSKFLAIIAIVSVTAFTGCTLNDAEIQTKINDQLKESPELSGVTATVEDGVATLSGMVQNEAQKSNAASIAQNASGVDSVVNNINVETPAPPSSSLISDDTLMEAAKPILEKFPGVSGSVSAGVITLTGTVDSAKKSALLDSLRTLHPNDINDQLTTIQDKN